MTQQQLLGPLPYSLLLSPFPVCSPHNPPESKPGTVPSLDHPRVEDATNAKPDGVSLDGFRQMQYAPVEQHVAATFIIPGEPVRESLDEGNGRLLGGWNTSPFDSWDIMCARVE